MKKWIITLVVCLTMLCGVAKGDPNDSATFWLFAEPSFDNQNNSIGTWLGYKKNLSEVGFAGEWRNDTQSNYSMGFYALRHIDVDVIDIFEENFWPIEFLSEDMTAKPAVGLQMLFDTKGNGYSFSPVVGLVFWDMFCVQYQKNFYGGDTSANTGEKIGISIQYKF
jgi:hypothetical protein